MPELTTPARRCPKACAASNGSPRSPNRAASRGRCESAGLVRICSTDATGRNGRKLAISPGLSPPHAHWTLIAFTGTIPLPIMALDRFGSDLQGGHHAVARAPLPRLNTAASAGARHGAGAAAIASGASLRSPGRQGRCDTLRDVPQIELEAFDAQRRRAAPRRRALVAHRPARRIAQLRRCRRRRQQRCRCMAGSRPRPARHRARPEQGQRALRPAGERLRRRLPRL